MKVYVKGEVNAQPRRKDNIDSWLEISRFINEAGFITKGQLLAIDKTHKQDNRFFKYCLNNRWLKEVQL